MTEAERLQQGGSISNLDGLKRRVQTIYEFDTLFCASEIKALLAEKDAEIADLKTQLEQEASADIQINEQIGSMYAEIESLKALLAEKDAAFDRKCAEASERTKILKSQDDESLMEANLLKCYGTQVHGFRVSTEHYRYLAEQVISLREDAKLRIFHAMQASEELLGMESLQQCICGHLRSQHSAGVWSCLERGENGWCMCTKFKGA